MSRTSMQTLDVPSITEKHINDYPLGSDPAEVTRLRNQHDFLLGSMGKLVFAPVFEHREGKWGEGFKVLDSASADGMFDSMLSTGGDGESSFRV